MLYLMSCSPATLNPCQGIVKHNIHCLEQGRRVCVYSNKICRAYRQSRPNKVKLNLLEKVLFNGRKNGQSIVLHFIQSHVSFSHVTL